MRLPAKTIYSSSEDVMRGIIYHFEALDKLSGKPVSLINGRILR